MEAVLGGSSREGKSRDKKKYERKKVAHTLEILQTSLKKSSFKYGMISDKNKKGGTFPTFKGGKTPYTSGQCLSLRGSPEKRHKTPSCGKNREERFTRRKSSLHRHKQGEETFPIKYFRPHHQKLNSPSKIKGKKSSSFWKKKPPPPFWRKKFQSAHKQGTERKANQEKTLVPEE